MKEATLSSSSEESEISDPNEERDVYNSYFLFTKHLGRVHLFVFSCHVGHVHGKVWNQGWLKIWIMAGLYLHQRRRIRLERTWANIIEVCQVMRLVVRLI